MKGNGTKQEKYRFARTVYVTFSTEMFILGNCWLALARKLFNNVQTLQFVPVCIHTVSVPYTLLRRDTTLKVK